MEQGAGPREQLAHFFADLGDQVDDEVEQYLLGVLGDEDANADDLRWRRRPPPARPARLPARLLPRPLHTFSPVIPSLLPFPLHS